MGICESLKNKNQEKNLRKSKTSEGMDFKKEGKKNENNNIKYCKLSEIIKNPI